MINKKKGLYMGFKRKHIVPAIGVTLAVITVVPMVVSVYCAARERKAMQAQGRADLASANNRLNSQATAQRYVAATRNPYSGY